MGSNSSGVSFLGRTDRQRLILLQHPTILVSDVKGTHRRATRPAPVAQLAAGSESLSHHGAVHHPTVPRTPLGRMLLHPSDHVVAPDDPLPLTYSARVRRAPLLARCLHGLRGGPHARMVVHTVRHPT